MKDQGLILHTPATSPQVRYPGRVSFSLSPKQNIIKISAQDFYDQDQLAQDLASLF